jgi:ATP-binding cassette, subfamily B, bacterial
VENADAKRAARGLLFSCLREVRWRIGAGVGIGLVWIGGVLAVPKLVEFAIDEGIRGEDFSALLWYSSLILVSGLIVAVFTGGRHWFAATTSRRVSAALRHRLFSRLMHLDAPFYDRSSVGELLGRTNADMEQVEGFVDDIPSGVAFALSTVAVLVILFATNASLAVVAVLCFPLLALFVGMFSRRFRPAALGVQERLASLSEVVEESVSGARVVKGFGAEGSRAARLRSVADDVYGWSMDATRIRARYEPAFELLPTLGLVAVLGYGGYLVLEESLTIGQLVAFNAYLLFLVGPIRNAGSYVSSFQNALAAAGRASEILDAEPEIKSGGNPLPPGEGELRFEGVHFAYEGRTTLTGLDLRVPAGSSLALVGETGCGKTTAAMLAARFYDPTEGRVLLDGADVREVRLAELRRAVGFVFEETFLFTGTLRENIAFANPDATDEEVERAARLAGAEEFIREMPEGYGAEIGERGYSLSGGQRQRVAIARAILADPRLLILDDATSAVDPAKEHEIRASLEEAMRHRTTIIIAHRPATIALADRVALMEGGRITAEGTHDALLEKSVRYRELFASGEGEACKDA